MKKNCLFCKIVNGDIDCAKIYEDENFLAFLDLNPNTKGMSVVLPKKHYDGYVFDIPNDVYSKFLLVCKKVSKILEKGLDVKRVAMVMEGTGVNHAHIKLYPMHALEKKNVIMEFDKRVYFDKYPSYITTKMGPQKDLDYLKDLAKDIKNKNK